MLTHDEFNALVRETAREFHMPELHARCYIINWRTANMCDRCKHLDDCAFVYALDLEKEQDKVKGGAKCTTEH